MLIYVQLVLRTLRGAARGRGDLLLEHLALRQQLAMYERRPRFRQNSDADRAEISLKPASVSYAAATSATNDLHR